MRGEREGERERERENVSGTRCRRNGGCTAATSTHVRAIDVPPYSVFVLLDVGLLLSSTI